MDMGESAPPAPEPAAARLLFGATLGEAFDTVFGLPWMFLKALILPVLLGIAFAIVGALLAEFSTPLMLAWQILATLPLAILGVAYCRLALLGRQAGAVPRPLFGRRTWLYFGYAWLLGIISMVPILAIMLLAFADQLLIAPGMVQDPAPIVRRGLAMFPVLILAYLVLMYIVTRLSLVFPAVAVDQKLGLAGSWRLTRGSNGLKLYAVLIVLYILCFNAVLFLLFMSSSIFGFFLTHPEVLPRSAEEISLVSVLSYSVPTFIVMIALEGLILALMIAAIARAYAQLAGRTPHMEAPERFE